MKSKLLYYVTSVDQTIEDAVLSRYRDPVTRVFEERPDTQLLAPSLIVLQTYRAFLE